MRECSLREYRTILAHFKRKAELREEVKPEPEPEKKIAPFMDFDMNEYMKSLWRGRLGMVK